MKVLITGAGGQVGHAVAATAPAHGSIEACTRTSLDIANETALVESVARFRPDVIVNAAAYTAVDRAEAEPELAHAVNASGPRTLAIMAREFRCRLIHLSTDYVFDGLACVPYRPDMATYPVNVYGISKLAGEKSVTDIVPDSSVVLRTAWVYAASGRNFLSTMLRSMRTNGSVRVVADQIGAPTDARSIAGTIWSLIQRPEISGTHHWTNAGVASWYDFAVAIAEEAAPLGLLPPDIEVTPIATSEYPTAARRPSYSVLDSSSLTALGFVPAHWRKRLRAVLQEVKNA